MANNPREFPKKESPLVKWYLSKYPGEAYVLPSGAVRLEAYDPGPGPGPDPNPDPDPEPVGYMLFNKDAMMDTVIKAVEDAQAGDVYIQAFQRAIDRWNKLTSYPEALITSLTTGDQTLPYSKGIVFDPEEFPWAPGSLAGGPGPSLMFVNRPDVTVAAAATPAKNFGFTLPANRRGQVVATGAMVINLASFPAVNNWGVQEWESIITHELGHWLGVNSNWGEGLVDQERQVITSGYYYALGGFNAYQGEPEEVIPLQIQGGVGTAGAHWEKNTRLGIRSIANEMMTGWVFADGSVPKITLLTQGALADYGYQILGHEAGGMLSPLRREAPPAGYACTHVHYEPTVINMEL